MFAPVPLTEVTIQAPIYCDGIAFAQIVGSNIQMVYYVEQLDALGQPERLITHRVIMPIKGLLAARDVVARQLMIATVPLPAPPPLKHAH